MKLFETKIELNTSNNISKDHYKPKKIAGSFDDKYIKYKSENDEKLLIKQNLRKIEPYLHMIDNLGTSGQWKNPSNNEN